MILRIIVFSILAALGWGLYFIASVTNYKRMGETIEKGAVTGLILLTSYIVCMSIYLVIDILYQEFHYIFF